MKFLVDIEFEEHKSAAFQEHNLLKLLRKNFPEKEVKVTHVDNRDPLPLCNQPYPGLEISDLPTSLCIMPLDKRGKHNGDHQTSNGFTWFNKLS